MVAESLLNDLDYAQPMKCDPCNVSRGAAMAPGEQCVGTVPCSEHLSGNLDFNLKPVQNDQQTSDAESFNYSLCGGNARNGSIC